jgi:RNA polymerase sigma factor (sigma-70 family)
VTRAQWGADESLGNHDRSFATIRKVIVHHTAIDEPDPVKQIQAIQRFHTQSRGWDDIGYNFLIDRAGTVYEGRWAREYASGELHDGEDGAGHGVIGAHAAGYNTGSVGIALMGTYSAAHITDAAMASLARTVAWKVGPRSIDPHGRDPYVQAGSGATVVFDNIAGHRDVEQTGCPGDGLYTQLGTLRDPTRIKPWLVSVAANETRQLCRGRRRRAVAEIDLGPGPVSDRDPAERSDVLDLADALRHLSTDERALLALRFEAGLDSGEIGRLTGRPAATVRWRLARLVARLRKELTDG